MPGTVAQWFREMIPQNGSRQHQVLQQPMYDVSLPISVRPSGLLMGHKVELAIKGQGTVSFNIKPVSERQGSCTFNLLNDSDKSVIKIIICNRDAKIEGPPGINFNKSIMKRIIYDMLSFRQSDRHIWISIDKVNCKIKFGIGYMMELNTLFCFQPIDGTGGERVEDMIRSIRFVELEGAYLYFKTAKLWNLPVVADPPHKILTRRNMLMSFLARNTAITSARLPLEAQRLHDDVTGSGVKLRKREINAINYSLDTPGCALYEKLQEKARISGNMMTTYIRVTLGENMGNSTGVPYVLEIWPKQHQSVVHDHGSSVAVIKVLHGSLLCEWYNPLPQEHIEAQDRIFTCTLKKGDVTWMTPEFYQTHTLKNFHRDTMAATIQCYSYLGADMEHKEHFDYITDQDHKRHRFSPGSDFEYEEMLAIVEEEYANRRRRFQIGRKKPDSAA